MLALLLVAVSFCDFQLLVAFDSFIVSVSFRSFQDLLGGGQYLGNGGGL